MYQLNEAKKPTLQEIIKTYQEKFRNWFKTRNTKGRAAVKRGKEETTEEIMEDVKEHFDCGICFEEYVDGEVGS